MKSLILAATFILFSVSATATSIVGADYNSDTEMLTLELAYMGGFKEHSYSLEYDSCQTFDGVKETAARLIDTGHDDTGRYEFFVKAQFSLRNLECKPSWLTIRSGRYSYITIWIE